MDQAVKTALHNLFILNWRRKAVSFLLAVVVWFVVHHSMTSTRTFSNIPVRVINVPEGKTVEGMQMNGRLVRRVTLTLVGTQHLLDELRDNELEVVLNAHDKPHKWMAPLTKAEIFSLNPQVDLSKGISKVVSAPLHVHMTKLVTEKLPVIVTRPFGEAPRGYQYLDIWPYRLTLTVRTSEELLRRLKSREIKLSLNLNDISRAHLDALAEASKEDVISLLVPDSWKQVSIPLLSETPVEINDPLAKLLRIDFIKRQLIPLDAPLPVSLFFPLNSSEAFNPTTTTLAASPHIQRVHGLELVAEPLYLKGTDHLFVQVVKERLALEVIAAPLHDAPSLAWSVQVIQPQLLEEQYISRISQESTHQMSPALREEYLRNRFRSYMNHLELYKADNAKFAPRFEWIDHEIHCKEGAEPPHE